MNNTNFAYGVCRIESCNCPAVEAGAYESSFSGSLVPRGPVDDYDDIVAYDKSGMRGEVGEVDEERAKKAWFLAIYSALRTAEETNWTDEEKEKIVRAQEGVEIAKRLGWIGKTFAFGITQTQNCGCPALEGGQYSEYFDGSPSVNGTISYYDRILRFETGKPEGEVPEEIAKRAWCLGIYWALSDAQNVEEEERNYLMSKIENGLKTAKSLGWI